VNKFFIPFCISAFLLLLLSCKEKTPAVQGKKYISVPSLIKAQIASIDTSLFVIRKILIYDSARSDTTFINRENFSKEAHDFLELPDLADNRIAKDYKQDSAIYEESLNRVIISYTAVDPDVELRREQVLITPSAVEGDKINSIIATTFHADRNGSVQKEMLWRMDKSFQVVTTTQLPGKPETSTTVKLTWNEDE
jgi:hypothetical protein